MHRLLPRFVARLILLTRAIDTAHRYLDKARSRAVVRWASPDVLEAFNALAYESDQTYVPGAARFRHHLFAWETAAIGRFFPAAPARLLIGGAGGGREAFALADRGYEVVAFEPAAGLAAGMAEASSPRVRAYRARYETLPVLAAALPGDGAADLHDLAPFDGALMGWGSFSHLLTEQSRVRALRSLAEVVDGPILVSFLAFGADDGRRSRGSDRRGDAFSVHIGYHHVSTPAELDRLARAAGLVVEHLETDESESSWPHAILWRGTH